MQAIRIPTFALAAASLLAQLPAQGWSAPQRLTDAPGASETAFSQSSNKRAIVADGETLSIVWSDSRHKPSSTYNIFFKQSTDGGRTWGPDVPLTTHTGNVFALNPSISRSGKTLHVTWSDGRTDPIEPDIWYRRSLDGGKTWQKELPLMQTKGFSEEPVVVARGPFVHVAWTDTYQGVAQQREVYYARSIDNGTSWSAPRRLTSDSDGANTPKLLVDGADVRLVYASVPNLPPSFPTSYIDMLHSADAGRSWGKAQRLVAHTARSYFPSLARTADGSLHLIWNDQRSAGWDLYYQRSTDAGRSWSAAQQLSSEFASYAGFLETDGDTLHLVWYARQSGYQILHRVSRDAGRSWSAKTKLVDQFPAATFPSLALATSPVHGKELHMIWSDLRTDTSRNLNSEIFYQRLSDPALRIARATMRIAQPADVDLDLALGSSKAGQLYVLTGGLSGVRPGLALAPNVHLPLNPDALTTMILGSLNTRAFVGFSGALDANGAARARFGASNYGSFPVQLLGQRLHFAAFTLDAQLRFDAASNAVELLFVQ